MIQPSVRLIIIDITGYESSNFRWHFMDYKSKVIMYGWLTMWYIYKLHVWLLMYYVIFTLTYDSIYNKKISYAILWFLLLTFNNLKFIHWMQVQDFGKKRRERSKLLKAEKATFKKRLYIKKIYVSWRGNLPPTPSICHYTIYIYFVLNMHERFVKMSNPKLSVNTCLYIYMWTGVNLDYDHNHSSCILLYIVQMKPHDILNSHLQYELVYIYRDPLICLLHLLFDYLFISTNVN